MDQRQQVVQFNRALLWLVPVAIVFWFAMSSSPPKPVIQVNEVSVPDAKALIDTGALVVDARGDDAHGGRRIPGALAIPLSTLQAAIPASLATARDRSIVVYCNDGTTTGPEATQVLNRAGYSKAVNLKSGIEGWERAGLAVAKP